LSNKPPNSTWTPEREKLLKAMWHQRNSYKLMCEKLNLRDGAIRAKLQRLGLSYVKKEGPTEKEKMINEIMKEKGITDKFDWSKF